MRYLLNDFAQGTDAAAPVRVEVRMQQQDPKSGAWVDVGGWPCDPIDGAALGPAWTNADLLKAVQQATGLAVVLP